MLAFDFAEKGNLWLKLFGTLYFRSVINNGLVYKFLWVLKNIKFDSKSKCVGLRFYQKNVSLWHKLIETPYFLILKLIFHIGCT
jgi:hypothetical protein